ncbi:MAG: cell division inhibitor SepF [Clostridia bacterium]|nr:cell division inhibitor SepF [Clostridia bacterium]
MSFWHKFLNWLGLEAEDDEKAQRAEAPEFSGQRKIISLPTAHRSWRLILSRPHAFEQAKELAEHLRSFRPLVVDLGGLNGEEAQRLIDFLSGATFALGGQVRKINGGIFLFAPSNVDISGDYLSQLESEPAWARIIRKG